MQESPAFVMRCQPAATRVHWGGPEDICELNFSYSSCRARHACTGEARKIDIYDLDVPFFGSAIGQFMSVALFFSKGFDERTRLSIGALGMGWVVDVGVVVAYTCYCKSAWSVVLLLDRGLDGFFVVGVRILSEYLSSSPAVVHLASSIFDQGHSISYY